MADSDNHFKVYIKLYGVPFMTWFYNRYELSNFMLSLAGRFITVIDVYTCEDIYIESFAYDLANFIKKYGV